MLKYRLLQKTSKDQVAQVLRNLPANAEDKRDAGSNPGSGRSPGGGYGNPLWYSSLKNPLDRGVWQTTVHCVIQSWAQLKRVSTHACNNQRIYPRRYNDGMYTPNI